MRASRVALLLLLLAAVLAAGAWFFRERLFGGGEVTEVSPEAAEQAERKLQRLRDDQQSVQLSEAELSSLLRYRLADRVPAALRDPAVALHGDTVQLSGRLAADQLPDVRELDRVRMLLPDTTPVQVAGHLRPLGRGRAAFEVTSVEVSGIPVPERFYPPVLQRLGRRDEPGLARGALALRLPPGVGHARVEGGHLVLDP